MERGQIVALATQVIPPENTPEKRSSDTLIATPCWRYVGPADTIRFEWQIGRWGVGGFAGDTERKYATRSQPASTELKEFTTSLPAISLSPLSPGYYDCEIWFKDKFSDLRVIVENCVRVVEAPAEYTLEISIEPPATGYVQVRPLYPTYTPGTSVELTAVAYPDYEFDHWGGDASGTVSPTSITMDSNKHVTAYFKSKVEEYELWPWFSPNVAWLKVDGEWWYGEALVFPKNHYVTLEAVIMEEWAPYYKFDYWEILKEDGTPITKSYVNPVSTFMSENKWAVCYFKEK